MATSYVEIVGTGTGAPLHKTTKLGLPIVTDAATTIPKVPLVLYVNVPDGSADTTLYAPCDLQVVDVEVIPTDAGVGAGDSVQLFNGADPVSDDIPMATQYTIVKAATIDTTFYEYMAGDTITLTATSANNCACKVALTCLPV